MPRDTPILTPTFAPLLNPEAFVAVADVVAVLDEDMLFDRVEVAGFKVVAEFVWAPSNI
jgi:hypothetical protein